MTANTEVQKVCRNYSRYTSTSWCAV